MQKEARTIDVSAKLEALRQRHCECAEKLKGFENRVYLTAEEEVEVRRLKKLKLFAKDEISRLSRAGHA